MIWENTIIYLIKKIQPNWACKSIHFKLTGMLQIKGLLNLEFGFHVILARLVKKTSAQSMAYVILKIPKFMI